MEEEKNRVKGRKKAESQNMQKQLLLSCRGFSAPILNVFGSDST